MAVVSRIATLEITGASGSRKWTGTASVQDTPAGQLVTVTVDQTTTGITPPVAATSFQASLFVDDTFTLVRTIAVTVFPQVCSFYLTNDGTNTGSARCGLLRIHLRAINTAGLAATQYDVNSDNGNYGSAANVYPTSFSGGQIDQGYIRGTTTALAVPTVYNTYVYGDAVSVTNTLGATPYKSYVLNQTFGPLSTSATSNTTTFTFNYGTCDNRLPASFGYQGTTTSIPNAGLTAVAWTALTTTETNSSFDPRLTFTHLHQDNDNTFGTPPTSKEAGAQRLASNLAFLNARLTNASNIGVNGITWTTTLQDTGALITPQTRSVTSATKGGQAGWGSTFLTWSDQLPTGNWTKTNVITAPANAIGLETTPSITYQLVAANPNYRLVCAGGPATAQLDARHMSPGVAFIAGLAVFNTLTMMTMALDTSPTPAVALGRFNLTTGAAEFLDSDGVWKSATGATVYYWPCTQSIGDANSWVVIFSNTSTWGIADVFVIGRCFIGGVPVNDFAKEIFVNGVNNHDKYSFDGAGFVGFPQK